jgi:hypothetical protein
VNYECKYEDVIETLRNCVKALESEIKVMSVEIREIKDDISEIKLKLNDMSHIKSDVNYLKGVKKSEEQWSRTYFGILKDLVLMCLMVALGIKMYVG